MMKAYITVGVDDVEEKSVKMMDMDGARERSAKREGDMMLLVENITTFGSREQVRPSPHSVACLNQDHPNDE